LAESVAEAGREINGRRRQSLVGVGGKTQKLGNWGLTPLHQNGRVWLKHLQFRAQTVPSHTFLAPMTLMYNFK